MLQKINEGILFLRLTAQKNEEIHNGKRNIYAVFDNLTTVLTFRSVYFPKDFRFTHKNAAAHMHESHFKKTFRVILVFELPQNFLLRQYVP